MVALNREDVMMAVSRFGHPDLQNSQTAASSPSKIVNEQNRVKKPVGGVPVLLGIGNISPISTPPRSHYVKPRTASQPLPPTRAELDEDDSNDYETISDDEYVAMIPSPAPVAVKDTHSFHQRTASQLPPIPRKSSAPERLHFATIAAAKSKDHSSKEKSSAQKLVKRMTVGNKPSIYTQDQLDDCSSLDIKCNRLFTQQTVRVPENPRSRSPLTNLVNGKSYSVPNLLAATDADLSNAPDQSSIRSAAYSSEDLYQEIQDTLSLDSPLLHRVSSTFHSVDDTYSSGSECSSTLGSTGDLTTQPQNRKKVCSNICCFLCSYMVRFSQ